MASRAPRLRAIEREDRETPPRKPLAPRPQRQTPSWQRGLHFCVTAISAQAFGQCRFEKAALSALSFAAVARLLTRILLKRSKKHAQSASLTQRPFAATVRSASKVETISVQGSDEGAKGGAGADAGGSEAPARPGSADGAEVGDELTVAGGAGSRDATDGFEQPSARTARTPQLLMALWNSRLSRCAPPPVAAHRCNSGRPLPGRRIWLA